jgi:hypothetical protein
MSRPFVSFFLLPLVRGGRLHVGRPLGARAVERLGRVIAEHQASGTTGEDDPVRALARARRAVAATFLQDAAAPPLDEATLRLGAALHDLLALAHPGIEGPGVGRRQERIAAAALTLARMGAPGNAVEAVNRHSLLARMTEIVRSDSTVTFWLGRQAYVGRVPPARVTALPALRRVRVDVIKRAWLREIGVPVVAKGAFLALGVASPLGEALDPLRLEPPVCWSRILPILRAPALGRIVAGRMLEVGAARAGDLLCEALLRFASFQDPEGGVAASPAAVAFALQFLAHLLWLDVLYGGGSTTARAGGSAAGVDLGVMLAACVELAPRLVWPPDVDPASDTGRAFSERLAALTALGASHGLPRIQAARGVVTFAASAMGVGGAPSPPVI